MRLKHNLGMQVTCLATPILHQYNYCMMIYSKTVLMSLALRLKIDMITTSPEFLRFGSACPGCFFDADEIKAHAVSRRI